MGDYCRSLRIKKKKACYQKHLTSRLATAPTSNSKCPITMCYYFQHVKRKQLSNQNSLSGQIHPVMNKGKKTNSKEAKVGTGEMVE